MLKLSKSGWNNVIIFAVMGFILIINMTQNKIIESDAELTGEQYIFAPPAVLLTLSVNQTISIERQGTTWQSNIKSMSTQLLDQMMMTWQNSQGTVIDAPNGIDRQMALRVHAMIASEQQPRVLDLYADDHQLLIYQQHNDLWLSLPLQLYNQLIPAELFDN